FNSYRERDQKSFTSFLEAAKKHKLDMTPEYEGQNTLAHLAVKEGEEYLLSKALELGVDINQKNGEGLTPLHLAAMQAKDETLLNMLITKGADKSILTDFDESAFDLANENEVLSKSDTDLDFLKASSQE
ncbi:MAG: ankyrin repeat domain-containing protein, partial [Bacteroidota bacterium]